MDCLRNSDEKYRCGFCPTKITLAGRIMLGVEVAFLVSTLMLFYETEQWLDMLIAFLVTAPFITLLAYGLFKKQPIPLLIFAIYQIVHVALISWLLYLIIMSKFIVTVNAINAKVPFVILLTISILINIWEIHLSWRLYNYLKQLGAIA